MKKSDIREILITYSLAIASPIAIFFGVQTTLGDNVLNGLIGILFGSLGVLFAIIRLEKRES